MKIQAYLDFRLIQASCISGMYSHIHNPRYIEVYLLTFGRILTNSVIFRILTQLDIFMFNKAYSKPTAHSGTFRNVDIFSQFHTGYSGTQEAIYAYSEPRLAYLEPWLIRHVMFHAYLSIFTKLNISRNICQHQGIFQQNQAYSGSSCHHWPKQRKPAPVLQARFFY